MSMTGKPLIEGEPGATIGWIIDQAGRFVPESHVLGDNYQRHLGRWTGFVNWWRSVFGFPLIVETDYQPETRANFAPVEFTPRVRSREPVAVAVEDFLSSWLVQRAPERAVAYFSVKSYGCVLELEPGSSDTA